MCRIAVVTGGSRGLGKAIVHLLHRQGFNVICGQRTPMPSFQEINNSSNNNDNEFKAHPLPNLTTIRLDLNDESSVQMFISHVLSLLPFIDILINNAAVCTSTDDDDEKYWDNVMTVNLFSHIQLIQAFLPLLHKSSLNPRVINISSGDGELLYFREDIQYQLKNIAEKSETIAQFEQSAYNLSNYVKNSHGEDCIFNGQRAYKLSKSLLNSFTRFMTRIQNNEDISDNEHENSKIIGFVAVCPGDVFTDMMDHHCEDFISPDEAANRIWPLMDFSRPFRWNGRFVRFGEEITW